MYCGLKTCGDCVRRSRSRDTVKAHEVTVSVSIAQAVDPPKSVPQFRETYREGQLKRIYDNPSPEHHFHVEYRLLPGCGSGVHRTDVVTYGVVSKVFTEKDSRVVKCWEEDGLTYYGWRHKHTFQVTREALLDLYHHTMEVRVWNARDKLSARARYDQPRAVRLPAAAAARKGRGGGAESGDDGGASARPAHFMVINHSEARPARGKRRRRLPKRSSAAALSEGSGDSDDSGAAITEEPPSVPVLLPGSPRRTSALVVPAIVEEREEQEGEGEGEAGGGSGGANVSVVRGGTEDGGVAGGVGTNGDRSGTALMPHPSHPAALSLLPLTSAGTPSIQGLSRHQLKRLEAEAAERAREEREGVAVLTLRMADLFANSTSISTKLSEPAQNLKGLEVGVALESQLMTESLRRELNPTTITVDVARCLPSTPVSHEELRKRCDPVFVKYQFLQQLEHRSTGRPQAADVTWAESRVILLGTLERQLLVEWLRGPPLAVEVHDRDRRMEACQDPAVFGMESRDDLLGTHAFGTGLARSPEAMLRPWDPYGVARADLSELLLGQRMLEVTTPITCGPSGPPPGEESVGVGPMGRALPPALPPGDYLHSQSELTITVELTYPLTPVPHPPTAPPLLVLPPSAQSSASRRKTSPSIPSRAKTPTPETPAKMLGGKASAATSPIPPHSRSSSVSRATSRRETVPPRSPSRAVPPSLKEPPSPKSQSLEPSSLKPQPSKLPSSQKVYRSRTSKVEEPLPSKCPFGRLVYVVSATGDGHSLVWGILSLVNTINQEALGLQDLSKDVVLATLSTYKLTRDQISSGECDVVTGFHVEDWEQHVLVLEGLAEGGVGRVWAEQPHHPTQAECLQQVFYNSEYTFSERLYGSLDVDLPRIHLYQPLSELVRQSAIFVRDIVPQPCLRALLCLSELSGGLVVDGMRGVTRNRLLPTAQEVMSLGLQFAVPAGFEVENGEQSPFSEDHSPSRPRTPLLERRDRSREPWEPLELQNPEYLQHLHQRSRAPPKDFITRNILHTQALAEQSSQQRRGRRRARSLSESALSQRRREETLLHTPVHNYSIQTLNSTELAKARLRRELSQDPAHRYTYCQHYHSMTVVPIDVEAEKRAKRQEAWRYWRTKEGFVYPGTLTARESNTLPQRPDPARIHDLSEPFADGLLHTNTQKPSVERLRFGWEQRSQDFERYRPPPIHFGPPPPPSIHLGGTSRTRELQEFLDREQEEWSTKVVVKDMQFHALRRGIRTELSTSGPRASSQLDKLTGILKDPPQKHSLRQEGLRLGSIPALDVVHNPSVDSRLDILVVERGERGDGGGAAGGRDGGYQPGPFQGRSLKLNGNIVPIKNQRTDSSKQLHSEEFRLYYHTPSFLHKRPAQHPGAKNDSQPKEEDASPFHRQTKEEEDQPQRTRETEKTAVERAKSPQTRESRLLEQSLDNDSCRPVHKEVTWDGAPRATLVQQT